MTRFGMLSMLGALALPACNKDETLSGYGAAGVTWMFAELDGTPFPSQATLTFPEKGHIGGQAPCNRYSSNQTAPYPWFKIGPIAATRVACPDLMAERTYFQALEAMSLAEVSNDTLILSNDEGREMLFKATDPDA